MPPAQRDGPIHEVADDVAVEFLLAQPGLLAVVLAEHVDDGTRHCRSCPGPQSGRRRRPCNVRLLAARSERVRVARAERVRVAGAAEPGAAAR
ncbi:MULTISPECIES: hypothetical protein [Pseudonocardia]|uniref:Uncharacterized protein n=2 Tax=Pseudonocardia TaxID=1847 RepID=A0A1Y2N3W3_PSEAH|nr:MULTISPECIES: hypothetical protein [Pseudonocardia]OSY41871.1 hypothetical protein BG845_01900 [Pseudonocardia autotrophica]TDN71077.1 hypothetical protein C8E95_0103 [Pseudonocardia autotrophica]BBG01747.1 hypothetical protein Pdca_29560 [Pseudonocardia autotrophica]GEC26304.1 hypothetical protein PSA01_33330 [Pseudonocardia saturnea]